MLKLHFKHPGFIYGACGPFTKHRERIQKFRETGNLKHLYRNELDKACFVHDVAYSDSNELAKTIISGKILKDTSYRTAINWKYDGYKRGLSSMVYKFFDKKTVSGVSVNEQLAEELNKPVIKNSKNKSLCKI